MGLIDFSALVVTLSLPSLHSPHAHSLIWDAARQRPATGINYLMGLGNFRDRYFVLGKITCLAFGNE
jgi:hypothetical protein